MRPTRFLIVVLLAFHVQAVTAQSQPKRPFETRELLREEHRALAPRVDWKPALEDAGERSVTLAVLYSLLLPGMGELYAGNFSSGKYYLIADAGLWLGYGGFQYYGR
jgi:hypothetical protein